MATYRLDTDGSGELVFVEEENGSFQTPSHHAPWEPTIDPADHHAGEKLRGGISCRP